MSEINSEVGILIRARRLSFKPRMTQRELADRCGLARTTIAKVETGQQTVTVETLYRIARGLGCCPSTLVRGELQGPVEWNKPKKPKERTAEVNALARDLFMQALLSKGNYPYEHYAVSAFLAADAFFEVSDSREGVNPCPTNE